MIHYFLWIHRLQKSELILNSSSVVILHHRRLAAVICPLPKLHLSAFIAVCGASLGFAILYPSRETFPRFSDLVDEYQD